MGSDAPPLMDDGSTMCLAYHLRNGCWSNCKRLHDHGQVLTAPEKQRLMQYLNAQLAKRAPQAQPSPTAQGVPLPP
jgi:hypothetical protein